MSAFRKIRRLREALRALDVDEERGILTAYGERFLFIPVKLIHSIEDRLMEDFGALVASSFQYDIGKQGGREYIRLAERSGYSTKTRQGLQKVATRLGTFGGWGRVDVADVDFEKKMMRIRWTNGVSVRNKRGKAPVCHFGRGVLTGAAEAVFGTGCDSLEVTCQGKGDDFCEAIIGEPAEIALIANSKH